MKIEKMNRAAGAASDLLKAMANPLRLKILCQLIDGEKSVGALAARLGIRDTLASQHLALLRRDRLVQPRRAGHNIYYAVESPAARAVIAALYAAFCAPAQIAKSTRKAAAKRAA